jgi:diguanylate cyclase (GGDEF)-like protein
VVQPDSRLRIGLVSCILFVESAWLAKAAWSEQRSNVMAGMRLVALFGGVLAALMATRTLAAATGLLSENLRPNLLNVGSILVGGMAMIGASLGLVYITTGDLLNRLQHSARHDPLTHLLNRQGLRWWLKGLPPIAKLEIAMVDLDHLKTINDKYGHAVGDRTIQRLAELLQSACMGDSCQAVRMGGEEFALIHVVPDLPFGTTGGPSDATLSAGFVAKLETLRQALHAQAEHPQASLSAGLAAGSVQSFEACLRIADLRLYDAKRRGRNQVVFS